MHLLIGIPSPEYVHNEFAFGNLPDIVSHTRFVYPDIKITIAHRNGTRTDANRNHILKKAIEDGTVDYILWLDCDMIYPPDIVERYFDLHKQGRNIDVIGCIYFKRSRPFDPIVYKYSDQDNKDIKPYKTILPSVMRKDSIYEVDGIGYGGMMVNMKVYEKLGKKRWTVYGSNFHLPFDCPDHMTHDLTFCKDVKDAGMTINIHGDVRPGHLASIPITENEWSTEARKNFVFRVKKPKVLVIIPTTDVEKAKEVAAAMQHRAGADCDIAVVEDDERVGFVKTLNSIARQSNHEAIVYSAQDVMVGQDWLKNALTEMMISDAGLVAFNDGKWGGRLASFGLVNMNWIKTIYEDGNIFHPGYHSHYGDTELTQIAKQQARFFYAETANMIEVDYNKASGKGGSIVRADKKLYKKRKKTGFDGLVQNEELLEEFS